MVAAGVPVVDLLLYAVTNCLTKVSTFVWSIVPVIERPLGKSVTPLRSIVVAAGVPVVNLLLYAVTNFSTKFPTAVWSIVPVVERPLGKLVTPLRSIVVAAGAGDGGGVLFASFTFFSAASALSLSCFISPVLQDTTVIDIAAQSSAFFVLSFILSPHVAYVFIDMN